MEKPFPHVSLPRSLAYESNAGLPDSPVTLLEQSCILVIKVNIHNNLHYETLRLGSASGGHFTVLRGEVTFDLLEYQDIIITRVSSECSAHVQ